MEKLMFKWREKLIFNTGVTTITGILNPAPTVGDVGKRDAEYKFFAKLIYDEYCFSCTLADIVNNIGHISSLGLILPPSEKAYSVPRGIKMSYSNRKLDNNDFDFEIYFSTYANLTIKLRANDAKLCWREIKRLRKMIENSLYKYFNKLYDHW